MLHLLIFLLLALGDFSAAKDVVYNFNVTWVTANPDGLAERKVVGINGQWPLPIIEVDKGDQLIVNMYNGLGDKSTSIHFHGMFQNGTNDMDGASMVTQCPIPPGSSFTYNFTVNQHGTYWYHCHTDYCYPDGYRQALIVHDKDAYFAHQYDEELSVTLSDWYHDMMEDIKPKFMSLYNPTGAEPIPNAFLFNDTTNLSLSVKPNTTYLLRLINTGAFVSQYFYIEDHTFKIVEIDGVYTEPTEADTLYISVAQRYAVLLTTKNTTDKNYPIVTVADSTLLDTIPSDLRLNSTSWLEYDGSAPHPQADITVAESSDLVPIDDSTLVPYDHMPLLENPVLSIQLDVVMGMLDTGKGYAFLNDISYTAPKVPTLYTALSAGNQTTDATVYGEFTHPMVLGHHDVVEIIMNNNDSGAHPFHLHGHNFQVLTRFPSYGADFFELKGGDPVPYDPSNHSAFPAYPPRRDTLVLPPQGHFVIRFVADNPGVWIFHCHIDWHLAQGLGMLFIEAPTQLQEQMTIPADHLAACSAGGIQSKGNAAGNTEDYTNLKGQNVQPGWIPDGFTARGIVSMVFTVLSAVLGMGSIVLYGLSDLKFSSTGSTDGQDVSDEYRD
ncbi:ferrooxidoreductase Fet3, putative [Talaromyces stipitatus ATCC 10500]|uniref:Ferrooxidoreductase Fet3, putative n=1 Tax=Talaromyces stipitatus (strain ATCC 10500 / CBS 375.48 / QM 6759 / NRRL 1006) TaxID=441959 RepID=B8MHQ4_TALSN|nr:ferrooxidoreductase Fet3, putative [Talaromyces stipitatus ATCC 10500]EED16384.1 ferrooxidoreductase Fet3, putative [Talaromyces stipitatus ATCC 10500]